MTLTDAEQQHYSRHLILEDIGMAGQLQLKRAKVLVVGAGGLGCPVLQYLTAAGVGHIGIIDGDKVELSNLQRQILYTPQDIGCYKATAAQQRLELLNPNVVFTSYPTNLTPNNALELFDKYDIIVDGTDNFASRYLINDAAVLCAVPVVFGSVYKFEGQVSVFNYNNGPTYRCLYPSPPAANTVPNCSEAGVLGVLPGMIGLLQANEVLKIICNIGRVLSAQLLTYNILNMQQVILYFNKNTDIHISALADNYQHFCGLSTPLPSITLDSFKTQKDNYNLLDIRTPEERAAFHIGGQHIPLNELADRYHELPTNKDLVIYCKSGVRSQKAIQILKNTPLTVTLIYLDAIIC